MKAPAPLIATTTQRVRLVDNLRVILKRAWSIRVAIAGVMFWGVVSALNPIGADPDVILAPES